jgi:anthranilate/para-aminobenzoate synthase component I
MAYVRELDPTGAVPSLEDVAYAVQRELGDCSVLTTAPHAFAADVGTSAFVCGPSVEFSDGLLPPAPAPSLAVGGGRRSGAQGWAGHRSSPEWIGVLPYDGFDHLARTPTGARDPSKQDARWTAPSWKRIRASLRWVAGRWVLEADDVDAGAPLAAAYRAAVAARRARTEAFGPAPEALPMGFRLQPIADPLALSCHAARVRRAQEFIAAGDVYLVNVARELRFRVSGSRLALFFAYARRARGAFGLFTELAGSTVCGQSPELALDIDGDRLLTGPIKGTRPRGVDAASDARTRASLSASEKEKSELVMSTDLHRNDLGQVARLGTVKVHALYTEKVGLFSRAARVSARMREGAAPVDAVRAILPCGSVTGAPKARAMGVIADLEDFSRGLYTGAYGVARRDGSVTLAVAIRTLVVEPDGRARFGSGGGIVADSQPDEEALETQWKAAALLALTEAPTREVGIPTCPRLPDGGYEPGKSHPPGYRRSAPAPRS